MGRAGRQKQWLKWRGFSVVAWIALAACGQNYNSDSNDAGANIGIDCSTEARLCAAYTALMSNHCFECHSWSGYTTDATWLNSGLVVQDNPTASMLIRQLQNSGGTMPQNYPQMSSSDYSALTSWIQNM